MQSVTLRSVSLGSTMAICAAIFAAIGLIVGALGLLASLLGFHIFITLPFLSVKGVAAGLASIPIMPAAFALAGLLVGLAVYLPLKLILWILRGLRVSGDLVQS
jgi:hypothetical protein